MVVNVGHFEENIIKNENIINSSLPEDKQESHDYKTPQINKYEYGRENDETNGCQGLEISINDVSDEPRITGNKIRDRFVWSEIGQIVHSNRKPEYSLSSILRRTNLFENENDENIENEFESRVGYTGNIEINEVQKKLVNNKYYDSNPKTLELLQISDIIKSVHREEIKIYLDEISFLRSQIISMNNVSNGKNSIATEESKEQISLETNKLAFNELSLNRITPIIIKDEGKHKLELKRIVGMEIVNDSLENKVIDDYVAKIENLNVDIQRQLERRNEQYAAISHEYLKQKGLLAREVENLKKEQEKNNGLKEQIERLKETLYKNEKLFSVELDDIKKETHILSDKCAELSTMLMIFDKVIKEISNYIISNKDNIENMKLFDYFKLFLVKLERDNVIKFKSSDNKTNSVFDDQNKNILELCSSIENSFLNNYIELIQKQKNTKVCNNYTQTHFIQKPNNIMKQKLDSIFIQSINFNNNNGDVETPIKVNTSFTCNYNQNYYMEQNSVNFKHNRNTDRLFYEKSLDYPGSVVTTRLRNEINVLKNQLDASKQKYKLKELENERLTHEISYLKNKIVRSKTYNSHNGLFISDKYKNENVPINFKDEDTKYESYDSILRMDIHRSRRSELQKPKRTVSYDGNWDEIFSVIQQLKDS